VSTTAKWLLLLMMMMMMKMMKMMVMMMTAMSLTMLVADDAQTACQVRQDASTRSCFSPRDIGDLLHPSLSNITHSITDHHDEHQG